MPGEFHWPFSCRLAGDNLALASEFSLLCKSADIDLQTSDTAPISVTVHSGPAALSLNSAIIDWRGLKIGRVGDYFLFEYQDWQLRLAIESATLDIYGPAPAAAERLFFREFFLRAALLFLLRRKGYFEFHGGAIVNAPADSEADSEPAGYIFLGASSSGKTSALIALIEAGWRYASDDALLLHRAQSSLNVYPLRRNFSLTSDFLARHTNLQPFVEEAVAGTDKMRLDPRACWPAQFISEVHPRFLISCRIEDRAETTVLPIPAPIMLTRLMEATPWIALDRETAGAQLEIFRSLAASCYSFELRAGRDLLADSSRLAALLAPAALLN